MIHPDTGIYLSEDYAFCKRWIDIGGKVYARIDIDLSHIGKHYFKGNVIHLLQTVDEQPTIEKTSEKKKKKKKKKRTK